MQTPDEELPAVVQETGKLVEKSLGNVRLEALISADKQFAAAQLFRYNDLMFHPDATSATSREERPKPSPDFSNTILNA